MIAVSKLYGNSQSLPSGTAILFVAMTEVTCEKSKTLRRVPDCSGTTELPIFPNLCSKCGMFFFNSASAKQHKTTSRTKHTT